MTRPQASFFDGARPDPTWSGAQLAALLTIAGLGPKAALEIAAAWPDPATYDADPARVSGRVGPLLPAAIPRLAPDLEGVAVVGYFDPAFPTSLRTIPNPPVVLWVRGQLPAEPGVAIVGTRNPSAQGQRAATRAAEAALGTGRAVISGLARGVDTVAHTVAVDHGIPTVAVLGGDVTRPSPAQNRVLAERILNDGGAIVAEVPPGTEANPARLVSRNRIQTGLSAVVVAAETGIPGGTLHTIRFALEQQRPVVIPKPAEIGGAPPSMAGNVALTADPADLTVLPGYRPDRHGARGLVPVGNVDELMSRVKERLR